jgi:hypothetical protein
MTVVETVIIYLFTYFLILMSLKADNHLLIMSLNLISEVYKKVQDLVNLLKSY